MMKFTLITITFILLFNIANAQLSTQPVTELKDSKNFNANYFAIMKQRNKSNTIGWICLDGGFALGVVGFMESFSHGTETQGETIFIIGNIIALASIPLFINAHNHKMNARLSLKEQSLNINFKNFHSTGIAFQYNF